MAVLELQGFKVYDSIEGQSLIIDSDRIDECMDFFKMNHFLGIAITKYHGYKLDNVDFLSNHPEIKRISITEGIENISGLQSLINLEFLLLSGKARQIDFNYFPKLKQLTIEWSINLVNIQKCQALEQLSIYNYSPKSESSYFIAKVPWLKKLKITRSTMVTLHELEKFIQLEELELNYCSKLETLCCLDRSKTTLLSLVFDHCKAIENHTYVTVFRKLSSLAFNECGEISSIGFIKQIPELKSFRFVKTNVVDGDISPCIGLNYAGFFKMKHYSHTPDQIEALS